MSYFLKKTIKPKGVYLQIYHGYYVPGVGKKNHSYRKLGYVSDLIASGISDPFTYFNDEILRLNLEESVSKDVQISDKPIIYNLGYFLPKAVFDILNVDLDFQVLNLNHNYRFNPADLFKALVYAQIINPSSKHKALESVIPSIFGMNSFSYDQVLDFINQIGSNYSKYVELLNLRISDNWTRNYNYGFFDCTNYYFEIDLEDDIRRKGPSKENRHDPIMGQALLLDGDLIPIDTEFYPGNESEKPYLRQRIENMKQKNNITNKVIQVADKGLNCARNIYSAVIEANDGYIFSKSIKGRSLSDSQRETLLKADNKYHKWVDVLDSDGNLIYKYKIIKTLQNKRMVDYGIYDYHCKINPTDEKETTFSVKEKRIITYNPKLAEKQKKEIYKEVEKLSNNLSYKNALKDELGDSAKYLKITTIDTNGNKTKTSVSLDMDKVQNDLRYAGYNMIVTSELNLDPKEIYSAYHKLWKIEQTFRTMKTYLEARPVFLTLKESIIGHFTIVYWATTIMRLLESKIFNDELSMEQLFEFIRQYNIVKKPDGSGYLNGSTDTPTYRYIKKELGLLKLGNYELKNRDINNLLDLQLEGNIEKEAD